jgi:hypothetical protein
MKKKRIVSLELNHTSEFWFQMFVILISLGPQMKGLGGKNNNGNYSLRLVPIYRLQPRLSTISDYCYCDRLHLWYQTRFCNPWLSGLACYSRTFRLSFLTPRRDSGMKCLSGPVASPEGCASVSVNPEPKLVVFWSPVTQSLKERFRFSSTYWTSGTRGPFSSGFSSPDAQTRRSGRIGSCFI